jgi:hypothetical protein
VLISFQKISTADFIEKHFYSWFAAGLQQKKSDGTIGACKLQTLRMGDFLKAVGGGGSNLPWKIVKQL